MVSALIVSVPTAVAAWIIMPYGSFIAAGGVALVAKCF